MTRVLDIPTVDYSAAHSAALRTRRAGTAADACLDDLAAALAPAWSGVASQAYLDGRAMVSREATALSQACDAMSRGIVDFADEAAAVLAGWRRDAERLAQLERGAADPGVLGIDPADVVAVEATITERDRLREAVAVWERRYDEAGALLAAACLRATTLLDDGVLSTADQLWAIPETLMDELVVAPMQLGAMLLDDPTQADDVVVAQWYALKDQVQHPVRTADEMSGGPQYRDGEWGEGTGTLLASVVGLWGLRRLIGDLDAGVLVHPDGSPTWPPPPGTFPLKKGQRIATTQELNDFRRYIDIRDASSTPRLQTLDELIARPDLERSEHPAFGHTLQRHVDVSDEYLEFRLREGTPENDGRVSAPVTFASRWADRPTAEAAVQQALRSLDADDRAALESSADALVRLHVDGPNLGEVWRLGDASPGERPPTLTAPATSATVVLVRRSEDTFILTTELHASPTAVWSERP